MEMWRKTFGTIVAGCALTLAPIVGNAATYSPKATMLFCAYGSVHESATPFAVAVIEISSSKEADNVPVSDFEIFDSERHVTKMNRVVNVEVFEDPPRRLVDGSMAYYLDDAHTHPWDGTLPAGTIRLRVRVALASDPSFGVFSGGNLGVCRLTVGGNVVNGPHTPAPAF